MSPGRAWRRSTRCASPPHQQDHDCGGQPDALGGRHFTVDEGIAAEADLLDLRCRVIDRWWAIAREVHGGERDAAGTNLFGMIDRAVDVVDARQRPDLVDDCSGRGEVVRLEDERRAETGDPRHVGSGEVVGAL